MSAFSLSNGTLSFDDIALFEAVPATLAALPAPHDAGILLRYTQPNAIERHVVTIGHALGVQRWVAGSRNEPWWMLPHAGGKIGSLPKETQFLLFELEDDRYALILPLLDGWFRTSLEGRDENSLVMIAETGDSSTVGRDVTALFIGVGDCPYTLMNDAAVSVMAHMGTGRLRDDKPVPEIVERFGWCTWDAFYQDVSHDKVIEGLQSFEDGGVMPRFMILDDGWQSVRTEEGGARRLSALCANEKFPGDLAPTVQAARDFGIEQFYVWHAVQGYWDGVSKEVLHDYRVQITPHRFSEGMLEVQPGIYTGDKDVGFVPPETIHRFYNDYHRHLAHQGVDGVKVDSQAVLESLGESHGGRVEIMQVYHEALEGSVHTHFLGGLINCMSCSNDMIYSALNSNITRSSTDFWPKRPETHGLHVWTNAVTSMWMGEFTVPDWDMFQSGHAMGQFHAVARSVSGGPIYVSDKPGEQDFDVLRALVFSDGSVPVCGDAGLPTRDCLFHDVMQEDVLLKIFNFNATTAVVAAFNCRYRPDAESVPAIAGKLRPSDADGISGEAFVTYLQGAGVMMVGGLNDALDLSLDDLTCDIATIAPINDGFAAVGMTNMYNCGGAIEDVVKVDDRTWEVTLRDGGEFLAWSRKRPKNVYIDGVGTTFDYVIESGELRLDVDVEGPTELRFVFGK